MEGSNLNDLPKDCFCEIISLTSPSDACSWSLVSRIYRTYADSNDVWERFLPSDYKDIIGSNSNTDHPESSKALYVRLSHHPILIDDGNMSFGLEKRSGKKILMLGARKLGIIWENNANYWRWISLPESRFTEVAELVEVWWFDVRARLERRKLSEMTTYGCYLVFKETEQGWSGFDERPMELIVGLNKIKYLTWAPTERDDGWMEIEIGDFFNDDHHRDVAEVEVVVRQTSDYSRKSGIIIQGIEFRPKQ
uniref:F-box domain-containing protein n=1 Tax=Davidia involucrata TaxID=16924 RepID=A0A5B7BBG2_DAVIN